MSTSTKNGSASSAKKNTKVLSPLNKQYHQKLHSLRAKGWKIVYQGKMITMLEKKSDKRSK